MLEHLKISLFIEITLSLILCLVLLCSLVCAIVKEAERNRLWVSVCLPYGVCHHPMRLFVCPSFYICIKEGFFSNSQSRIAAGITADMRREVGGRIHTAGLGGFEFHGLFPFREGCKFLVCPFL